LRGLNPDRRRYVPNQYVKKFNAIIAEDTPIAKVVQFVEEFWPTGNTPVMDPTTQIEYDLGITGDDSVEFMDEFFERFEIDASGYDHSKYFGPEGFGPPVFLWIHNFIQYLRGRPPQRYVPIYALMLNDLARVIEAKRWINFEDCSERN